MTSRLGMGMGGAAKGKGGEGEGWRRGGAEGGILNNSRQARLSNEKDRSPGVRSASCSRYWKKN